MPDTSKLFSVAWSDDGLEWVNIQTDDFPSWNHPFISVTRNNLHPTAAYAARCSDIDYRKEMARFIASRC